MVNWAILGTSKISESFSKLLKEQTQSNTIKTHTSQPTEQELLNDSTIDAVYICSSNLEQASLFLKHKKHVVCENLTGMDVQPLVDLAAAEKLFFNVLVQNRFCSVRDHIVNTQSVGKIHHVSIQVSSHDLINSSYVLLHTLFGRYRTVKGVKTADGNTVSAVLLFPGNELATLIVDPHLDVESVMTFTGENDVITVKVHHDGSSQVTVNATTTVVDSNTAQPVTSNGIAAVIDTNRALPISSIISQFNSYLEKGDGNKTIDLELYNAVHSLQTDIAQFTTSQVPSQRQPTRWGIVSVGKISSDFVTSMASLPKEDHEIIAVASRSLERSKEFADKFNINKAYGSYEELAADPNVDIVYIGSINTEHLKLGLLYLDHNKHILCEKPLTMNRIEAEKLILKAKEKNLFLMEAIWSRFFPAYDFVKKLVRTNIIGDVHHIVVNFAGKSLCGKDRVTKKELGGSVVLDIGIYAIQLVLYLFGKPDVVKATGLFNEEGIDESCCILLSYKDGKVATLSLHSRINLKNEVRIVGSKGEVVVHEPFWCPTKVSTPAGCVEFPLPDGNGQYKHKNSAGLCYQADEVRRCINAGLTQCPVVPWNDSLDIAEVEDEIIRQLETIV